MKNYYFSCDINLDHPGFSELRGDDQNIKAMSFTSRAFLTPEACFNALQADAMKRVEIIAKRRCDSVTRIDELNPMHTTDEDELQARMDEDEAVRNYVNSWDQETITRITITADDIEEESDPVNIHEMGISYILRYELCDYEDELDVPSDGRSILIENATSSLQ